ncbi:hypothetical protein RYX36_037177 [Vicia faba]
MLLRRREMLADGYRTSAVSSREAEIIELLCWSKVQWREGIEDDALRVDEEEGKGGIMVKGEGEVDNGLLFVCGLEGLRKTVVADGRNRG